MTMRMVMFHVRSTHHALIETRTEPGMKTLLVRGLLVISRELRQGHSNSLTLVVLPSPSCVMKDLRLARG
jgi:hypothetical protein